MTESINLDDAIRRDNIVNDFLQAIPPLLEQGLADFKAESPERSAEVAAAIDAQLADLKIEILVYPEVTLRVLLVCRETVAQGGFPPLQLFCVKVRSVPLNSLGGASMN